MKHILFISNKNRQIAYMKRMAGHEALAGRITVSARRYTGDPVFDEEWTEALASADIVLVTHMGTGLDTRFMQKMAKWLQKHHHRYLMLVEEKSMDGLLEGITLEEAHQVSLYLAHSGEENYVNLMNYLAALDGDGDPGKVTPPKSHPWCGIVGRRGKSMHPAKSMKRNIALTRKSPAWEKSAFFSTVTNGLPMNSITPLLYLIRSAGTIWSRSCSFLRICATRKEISRP